MGSLSRRRAGQWPNLAATGLTVPPGDESSLQGEDPSQQPAAYGRTGACVVVVLMAVATRLRGRQVAVPPRLP
jgi:hypothetical protein